MQRQEEGRVRQELGIASVFGREVMDMTAGICSFVSRFFEFDLFLGFYF